VIVGVRELKQSLSRVIDRAAAGEEVVVTERGRPKVRIVAVTDASALDQGVADGRIRPPLTDRELGAGRRHRSERRVLDMLADDRSDA
jgi:prevent-host-death family protein